MGDNQNNQNQNQTQPQGGEMGEGNRQADRQYRDDVKKYVDSGRPDEAGKEAQRAVDDDKQRPDLENAERIGKSRSAEPNQGGDQGVKKG
jgi:hypothetical protein